MEKSTAVLLIPIFYPIYFGVGEILPMKTGRRIKKKEVSPMKISLILLKKKAKIFKKTSNMRGLALYLNKLKLITTMDLKLANV